MKLRLFIVSLISILVFCCSCSGSVTSKNQKQIIDITKYNDFDDAVKGKDEFYLVANNEKFDLYVNGKTAEIKLLDKVSTKAYYSNPQGEDNGKYNHQFKLEYFNQAMEYNFFYSSSDSVELNQYNFEKTEDGFIVNYKVGKQKEEILLPTAIKKSDFSNLLNRCPQDEKYKIKDLYTFYSIKNLSDEQKSEMIEKYSVIKSSDIYIIQPSGDFILKRANDLLIEIGYTKEDKQRDEIGSKDKSVSEDDYVNISIEYSLGSDGLSVNIPNNKITYSSEINLVNIELLPYFGAASVDDNGYIFVPDGSGSLINFNNNKSNFNPYNERVYGKNHSLIYKYDQFEKRKILLPVFGMKYDSAGFIAVIESGSEVSSVVATVSDKTNEAYNKVYPTFLYTEHNKQKLLLTSESEILAKNTLSTDIKLNYLFLDGLNSDYVGMALKYQDYLKKIEVLDKTVKNENNSAMLIKLLGAVEYKSNLIGIPFTSYKKLTSYNEAKLIVDSLNNKGIENFNINYYYWVNNANVNSINDKVDFISQIGGKKGYKDFISFCKAKDIKLFSDVDFMYVVKNELFDSFFTNSQAVRNVLNDFTYNYQYDLITNNSINSNKKYFLTGDKLNSAISKFSKDYKKYNDSISVGNMGADLVSDFNNSNLAGRENYLSSVITGFEKLQQNKFDIMVKSANQYSIKYASVISDTPLTSSGFYISDQSVPFYQIVFHGYKDFYSEDVNEQSNPVDYYIKCLETGTMPSYKLIYEDNSILKDTKVKGYSLNYSQWVDFIAFYNERSLKYYKNINGQTIKSHTKIGDDVYKTQFSNLTTIYTNYSNNSVELEGNSIAKKDFLVVYNK